MYSSDFGIVSDGQLHNMQRDLVRRNEEEAAAEACERMPVYREKESGILGSLLSNLKADDLIIIAAFHFAFIHAIFVKHITIP